MGKKHDDYYDENGRLNRVRRTTLGEDVKDIVSGLSRMLSPKPLRERRNVVDDATNPSRRQSTDHDY